MIEKATDLAFSVSSAAFVAFGFSLCQKTTLDNCTYVGRLLCGPLPALCPQHLTPGTDFFPLRFLPHSAFLAQDLVTVPRTGRRNDCFHSLDEDFQWKSKH